jgi:Flp pilus assembly protein TadD
MQRVIDRISALMPAASGRSVGSALSIPPVLALILALALAGCTAGPPPAPGAPAVAAADPAALEARAVAALGTGRAAQARDLYRALLLQKPGDASAVAGLGEAERLLGQHDAALAHARAAYENEAAPPAVRAQALVTAGAVLLVQRRHAEAEDRLLQAVAFEPADWRGWNALGQARDQRQAWAVAAQAYVTALDLAPEEVAVLNNFGMSQLGAGNHWRAEELFTRALTLAPDLQLVQTNLRLARALQGRYDAALSGMNIGRTPESLNNVGYAALLRGDYPKARELFLQAIDASPSFYEPAWKNLQYLDALENDRNGRALESGLAPGNRPAS